MMLAEAGGAAYLREFQQRFSPGEEKFFAKEPREWKVARCDKYGREGGREGGRRAEVVNGVAEEGASAVFLSPSREFCFSPLRPSCR